MPQYQFTIGGKPFGQEVEVEGGLADHTVEGLLNRALNRRQLTSFRDAVGDVQRVAVQGENRHTRALMDTGLDKLDRELAGANKVMLELRRTLEGGASGVVFTRSAWTKLLTIMAAIVSWFDDDDIEFVVLGFGPRDKPWLITDILLVRGQQVSKAHFRCDDDALARTLAAAPDAFEDLELRAVIHKHPGLGANAAYHSSMDEEGISGSFMPLIAQLLYQDVPWRRALLPAEQEGGILALPLDDDGELTVELTPAAPADPDTLKGCSATLRGTDMVATVFSVVITLDGHAYGRAIEYRSATAPVEDAVPLYATSITDDEVPVEVDAEHRADVARAEIPDDDELEWEIRSSIRRVHLVNSRSGGAVLESASWVPYNGQDTPGNDRSESAKADPTQVPATIRDKLEVAARALVLAGKALFEVAEALVPGGSEAGASPRGEA